MDQLLSSSFDMLSSYDPVHIRRGLRCLEGFLAKICLSTAPALSSDDSSASSRDHDRRESRADCSISSRPTDAAFREFIRLQSGFEWNVTIRLVSCLERLLGRTNNNQTNLLILSTLELIQGMLLIHPPSRKLFAREIHMNVLLDLLDAENSPAIQSATILTLVHSLLGEPANTRTFEVLDGLATVTSLFKHRDTQREVKLKLLEFFYFYLMPEDATSGSAAVSSLAVPAKKGALPKTKEIRLDKTTQEKQKMLGEFLNNVEGLVADLRDSQPFGI